MAESVVKLRLESGEYDSKIKRAAQNVLAFGENCQKAGQSVSKAEKETLDYVRSIGQMETVAKNAKGKINEMTNAFTELSVQYKHLTDQEKQSPFGVALAQSLDQLKNRVKDAKADLQSIGNELGGKDSGGAGGGMGKLDGMLSVFGGNMLTKAAGWAMNFASEIGNCVEEGTELAKAGEGIRLAFERLNRPDLLDNLREATHGTVTDIELMKQAVKFNDFKLSLDEMGALLAFAQQKAKDTGESVDYMVESIVTGLGRQSPQILDNLGISANEVKEKMKSTGDMTKAVAEIIKQQMSNAGDYIETAADRAAKADTDLKNAMEDLGRTFGPIESAGASMWNTLEVGALKLLNNAIKPLIDRFTELGRLRREYELGGGASRVSGELDKLGNNKSEQNYKMLLAHYDLEINKKQQQLASLRNDAKMNAYTAGSSKFYAEQTNKLQAEIGALYKMRTEFVQGADKIFNPVVDTPVSSSATTTKKTKKTGKSTGSHKITPQERAADMVANAERTYSETLLKNSIRMEAGIDTTLENKKKELSAQERLFDAYSDAYATYKDPKYKTAIDDSANKIKSLAEEVKAMEDEVKKSKEKWVRGLSGFNAETMTAWLNGRQGDLSKSTYGSAEYAGIMGNIADMKTIKTVLERSMKAGIDASQFNMEPLWEKVFDGENIPNETWQKMVDTINEKLKQMDLKPIKIDFNTGEIDSTAKNTEKSWRAAANAVQSVGGALQQLEDPGAKIMGIIGEAIANIALGFAQATASDSKFGVFGWIAAIAGGLGTMISTISAIKSATAGSYAEGGIIPGNNYNDGLIANVSSGELILNRAQQNSIAGQLTSNQGNGESKPYLDVETIWLGLGHFLKRKGMGEIVTTR